MDCTDTIKALIAGYPILIGVIVWQVRMSRKDLTRFIKIMERCTTVLEKVEGLLTNWRGH